MNAAVRTLLFLTLAHALVDLFAAIVQPLWPDFQHAYATGSGSVQWAYVVWGLATSVSQLVFGYWGDRDQGRWLLWIGPAAGVICLSALGLAPSFGMLCVLLVVGGLGIAAFHPEAAALAGSCNPEDRSRAMSIFAVGGYLGQAAGPIYSGAITTHAGLHALAWGIAWGMPVLAFLALGMGKLPAAQTESERFEGSLRDLVRGRESTVGLVVAIGVLRVLPALGVPVALAFLLKLRGQTNEQIGVVQGVFLAGIGAGSLGCALLVRRANERRILWQLPLWAAPLVAVLPALGTVTLPACAGLAGLLLGATMPILVGYGQRLIPEGQRVASSITMGVTWGLGGVVVAATMALVEQWQRPDLALGIFALGCVLSSLLCTWLPDPGRANVHCRPELRMADGG